MFGEEEVGRPRHLWCCTCCCCCWFVGGEMWIVTGYPRSPWPRSSTRKSRMFGGWSAKALQGRKMGRNWKAVNIFQFWNFFRLAMIWERNVLVLHQSRSILSQYYWPLWWWKNASFSDLESWFRILLFLWCDLYYCCCYQGAYYRICTFTSIYPQCSWVQKIRPVEYDTRCLLVLQNIILV